MESNLCSGEIVEKLFLPIVECGCAKQDSAGGKTLLTVLTLCKLTVKTLRPGNFSHYNWY